MRMSSELAAAIKTVNLTISFGHLVAVDDFNNDVEKREVYKEVCQRVEDDPETQSELPEMPVSSTEQIKVFGDDRFE